MTRRQRLLGLAKRDATLLFWANSARYGFWLVPRITRDSGKHTMIVDARWLCFGVNLALVDEDRVSRASRFDAP